MNKKVLDKNKHKKEAYRECKQGDLDREIVQWPGIWLGRVKFW